MCVIKKELEFAAKFDTSEFDKSIAEMKKKLAELQAPSEMMRMQNQTSQRLQASGLGGVMSGPGKEAYAKATLQSRRELEQSIKAEAKIQEQLGKEIVKRVESLKKLKEVQQSLVSGSKEELEIKEKIAKVQENTARQQENYKQRDAVINQMLEARSGSGQMANTAQSASGGGNGITGAGLGNIFKGLSAAFGSVAAIAAGGTALVNQDAALPRQTNVALASQTQNITGNTLQSLASGNFIKELAFSKERQEAAQSASAELATNQKTDLISQFGKGTYGLLTGNKEGNLLKNTLGSALQYSLSAQLLGQNKEGSFLDNFNKRNLAAYQAQSVQEGAQNYQQNYEANVAKDPLKALAASRLTERSMQDLNTQRTLGYSDEEMFGQKGFQSKANKEFNQDLAAQAAQQAIGAGGSTRGVRGMLDNNLALKAQRGMDLTNAASVYGRISGGAGTSQATDAVFKALLTESVKNGLDKSEYREEQRKFVEITSQVLSNAGVKTAEDAANVGQGFSRFIGQDTTMKGLEGSKSAYQEQQSFSADTNGRGGALQFAGLVRQPGLAKLGAKGIGGLMQMPEQDLTSTNPYVVAMATEAGMKPEELIKKVTDAKREKSDIEVGLSPKRMRALSDYMVKNKLDVGTMTQDQIKAMPEDIQKSYYEANKGSVMRSGYENSQKQTAVTAGLINATAPGLGPQLGPATPSAQVQSELDKKTGRIGDEAIAASGKAAEVFLNNFRDFKTVITPASEALDALTQKMILWTKIMSDTPDASRASVSQGALNSIANGPRNQATGSKPSGK